MVRLLALSGCRFRIEGSACTVIVKMEESIHIFELVNHLVEGASDVGKA